MKVISYNLLNVDYCYIEENICKNSSWQYNKSSSTIRYLYNGFQILW